MKCVYGRAGVRYVITKCSRMDSLPNFVSHGAPLRALRARELRYKKLEERICPICKKDVEDEIPFLTLCPAYQEKKKYFI